MPGATSRVHVETLSSLPLVGIRIGILMLRLFKGGVN